MDIKLILASFLYLDIQLGESLVFDTIHQLLRMLDYKNE